MSNRSYVCLKCRTSKRADAAYGLQTEYRCPICQGNLIELPWNWRIPKLDDDVEWKKLGAMATELNAGWIPPRQITAQEELARIERQIERLLRQKPSTSRDTKLATLYRQKRLIKW